MTQNQSRSNEVRFLQFNRYGLHCSY